MKFIPYVVILGLLILLTVVQITYTNHIYDILYQNFELQLKNNELKQEMDKIRPIKKLMEVYKQDDPELLDAIVIMADRHGIDAHKFACLIASESSFRRNAKSPCGALGVGQVMRYRLPKGSDWRDPYINLDASAGYIRRQLDRFGSWELALAAYNAGPSRVARCGGVPRIRETHRYLEHNRKLWAVVGV